MNTILPIWLIRWWSLQITASGRHAMDELLFDTGCWSDRNLRQAMQVLSPDLAENIPREGTSPHLPTPTDVPVPDPTDVPVPEPRDVPPPDPHDLPPAEPKFPEPDPQPRPIP